MRVLYELTRRKRPTATELAKALGLDAGYLSRILRSFEKRGLLDRKPSDSDARQSLLGLTKQGRETFATLNARSHEEILAMLGGLSAVEQQRLPEAMHTIERLLGARSEHDSVRNASYLLRPH